MITLHALTLRHSQTKTKKKGNDSAQLINPLAHADAIQKHTKL